MTSEKAMLSRVHAGIFMLVLALAVGVVGGCQNDRIEQPRVFSSPYPETKLWAVAPLRNDSGTSLADGIGFAERLSQQLQQVPGIDVVPLNRVIEVMEFAEMRGVYTLDDAMELVDELEVDGLLVGTLTAWEPYEPPTIGVTVQLYSRRTAEGGLALDEARRLSAAPTEQGVTVRRFEQPVNAVSHHFDAASGAVLQDMRDYAKGRVPLESPAGWRRYLLDMDLYTEFVAHEVMRRLFRSEWSRLRVTPSDSDADAEAEAGDYGAGDGRNRQTP